MRKYKRKAASIISAVLALAMVATNGFGYSGGGLVTASEKTANTYQGDAYESKLPVLYIDTEGGQEITSKEDYINGSLKIQGNEQYNDGNTTLYDGAIQIRGRGNTTWGYDKKPYKIKLDTKTDLFGFGANKHWVLLANYTDESHMRNMLSYNLSGEMGMPYMQSVHVDLILNGQYKGTYQFCEQVKISQGRVNIHDWEDYAGDVAKAVYKAEKENGLTKDDQDAIETLLAETDMGWMTSGKFNYRDREYTIKDYLPDMPDFTGGFLLELDSYYDEYSKFKTSRNQPLQFKNPEFIATNEGAMNYVKNYINAFEDAISASDYTTTYQGETKSYSQLFDMDSLVQFWMVNELFLNVDAMKKSTYMYKDIDGLLHMGPIWDMDWSSDSLVSSSQGSGAYNVWQTVKFSDGAQANQWYKSVIQDPYFAVKTYELYARMRAKMGEMVADNGTLAAYQSLLAESAQANESLWYQNFGNNPWNPGNNQKDFATQIQRLKTYLTNRLNWLDAQFASVETLAKSLGYKSAGGIAVENADIVVNDAGITVITAKVTDSSVKAVEFLLNGVKLGTAPVTDGKAVFEAPATALVPVGSYNTVQVFGLNESGSVILSGSNKVTDYAKFITASQGSTTDPTEPTEPTPPSGSDDSNHSTGATDKESQKPLKAPEKVSAAQLSSSQNVKVTFGEVKGAKSYEIYRSTKVKGVYQLIGNTTKLSYTDKKVKKGKTYYYKVKAKAENSAYDSLMSQGSCGVKVLARPSVRTKAGKAGKVEVRWKKITGAKGYVVYTSAKKAKGYKAVKTVNKSAAGKVTVKASGKARKIYVKVRAFRKVNGKKIYGPYSRIATVKVKK